MCWLFSSFTPYPHQHTHTDPFSALSTLLCAPDAEPQQSAPGGSWAPFSFWLSSTLGSHWRWERARLTVTALSSYCHGFDSGHTSLGSSSGGQPLIHSCSSHQLRDPSLSLCPLRPGSGKGVLLLLVPGCFVILRWHPQPCSSSAQSLH